MAKASAQFICMKRAANMDARRVPTMVQSGSHATAGLICLMALSDCLSVPMLKPTKSMSRANTTMDAPWVDCKRSGSRRPAIMPAMKKQSMMMLPFILFYYCVSGWSIVTRLPKCCLSW